MTENGKGMDSGLFCREGEGRNGWEQDVVSDESSR